MSTATIDRNGKAQLYTKHGHFRWVNAKPREAAEQFISLGYKDQARWKDTCYFNCQGGIKIGDHVFQSLPKVTRTSSGHFAHQSCSYENLTDKESPKSPLEPAVYPSEPKTVIQATEPPKSNSLHSPHEKGISEMNEKELAYEVGYYRGMAAGYEKTIRELTR